MAGTPWPERRVSDLAAKDSNALATGPFGSSISSRFFRSTGVPVIRGGNLSTDPEVRLVDEDLVFLTPEKAREFSRSIVRRGDLVFTSWGTINQVGLIDDSATYREYVISNKQMKVTVDPAVVLPEYIYYQFSGPEKQRQIAEGSIGTSVPGFNLTRLRSMVVPLPELPEQAAIVEALADSDRLIASLNKIIAKKRGVRRGIIQALTTGDVRLPGFDGPWSEPASLTEVALRFAGYWGRDVGTSEVDVRVIRAGDVGSENQLVGFAQRALTRNEDAKARCEPGDVVLTASGTIGNVAYIDDGSYCVSNFVRALRPRFGLDGRYLYYALQTRAARDVMTSNLGLSAMPNLGSGFFREKWLRLPELEEQRAIASVLQDADIEIASLKARRDSARAIKQGMMQELLTGRTRLVTEEVSA